MAFLVFAVGQLLFLFIPKDVLRIVQDWVPFSFHLGNGIFEQLRGGGLSGRHNFEPRNSFDIYASCPAETWSLSPVAVVRRVHIRMFRSLPIKVVLTFDS